VTAERQHTPSATESPLHQHGKLSYLEIPAIDARQSAAFYARVFGWNLRGDNERPSFDDPTGDMIGRWVTDRAISREPGLMPYVSVTNVDDTVEQIVANGGEIVKSPYPEGDLWVATFRDPAGNLLGIWQRGQR
jgi:predicted enzyme related to lactoylglutathione lyase